MIRNLLPVYTELSGRCVLYRSGQPHTIEDWRYLRSLGVRRVVKLNAERDGSDDYAAGVGLDVFCRPLPDMAQFPASETYLATIDNLLPAVGESLDNSATTTLVHCTEGVDRTGLLVARWRVRVCGWTPSAAHNEWLQLGSHRYAGLEEAWRLFVAKEGAA